MKRCYTCQQEKPLDDFPVRRKRGGGHHARCRSCMTAAIKKWKAENPGHERERQMRRRLSRRTILLEHLVAHPCVDCGIRDLVVLEFDHIAERGPKSFAIAEFAGNYGTQTVIDEISKCEIRCANCHRRKTAQRNPRHWSHLPAFQGYLEMVKDKPNQRVRRVKTSPMDLQLNLFV